jgi:hypothetical protein
MTKIRFFLLACSAILVPAGFEVRAQDADRSQAILKQIDAVYATIPPVKYQPAADRWKHLPKTVERLRQGGTLRIVMLGDSIVNDTSHSQFDRLLERTYPKCKVVKVISVRGSTGCWWYKEDGRVKEWVLDHKPDLVLIGGISQRDDVESIREVIRQTRAGGKAEILVMSGAFGSVDPRDDKQWKHAIDPKGTDYRARLLRMAAEEKVEFLDMSGPWGQYMRDSGKDLNWYKRDPVHANDRGFQVLGRILEKYFAPKEE